MTSPAETMIEDPAYRIAYDLGCRKVGCVLIQAALGGDVPNTLFYAHFGDTGGWTTSAHGCRIYTIRRSQLAMLAARTSLAL